MPIPLKGYFPTRKRARAGLRFSSTNEGDGDVIGREIVLTFEQSHANVHLLSPRKRADAASIKNDVTSGSIWVPNVHILSDSDNDRGPVGRLMRSPDKHQRKSNAN
jgi:hypothetical protein